MDSDDEWNLDDDEEVVMPRELPKGNSSGTVAVALALAAAVYLHEGGAFFPSLRRFDDWFTVTAYC